MNGWSLSLIAPIQLNLDASAMSAIETCTQESDVCNLSLLSPRPGREVVVGDLLKVRRTSNECIAINGDMRGLHQLGFGWTTRTLVIEGDVGAGLGTQMRGGSIRVMGHTMASAGCQMRGGEIRVLGNTGDYLGGPLPGRRSGMSGGRIIVNGNAGHHSGHRMRRGTILIAGDCGDGIASDMVAGTIVAGGNVGEFVAAGMRRGTVILARATLIDPIRFTPFRDADLGVSRLIATDLAPDAPAIATALIGPVRRCLGDRSVGGRGEILVIQRPE
jgi:formylmethanofuran dehydrogenase subunit C